MDQKTALEYSSLVVPDPYRFGVPPILVWAAFLIAFAVAIPLDTPVSTWVHDTGVAGFLRNHEGLAHLIRVPGRFEFPLLATAILFFTAARKTNTNRTQILRKPSIVLLAGVLSSANAALKWCIGRTRPYHGVPLYVFHPFHKGLSGLVHAEQNLSFPSGDCSLAFAMSAALSMVVPKLWLLWWFLGMIVACERVAENAHYPTDAVAGAALGVAVAILSRHAVRSFIRTENDPRQAP